MVTDRQTALRKGRARTRVLAVALLGLSLGACSLIAPAEAPRNTYELTAPDTFPGLRSGSRSQVLVKLPNALKSIDSDRILVRESDREVTYLAGVQWTDTVPRLVQTKLVEALENSEAVGAAAKPGDGLVIDYQMISEIRRFEIQAVGDRRAIIEISIKLLSDRSGRVVATRIFQSSAPAPIDAADTIDALDNAFDQIAREIVGWVVRQS